MGRGGAIQASGIVTQLNQTEDESMAHADDPFKLRIASRKFVVFGVATLLLALSVIDQQTWQWVTAAYLGANAIEGFAGKINVKGK